MNSLFSIRLIIVFIATVRSPPLFDSTDRCSTGYILIPKHLFDLLIQDKPNHRPGTAKFIDSQGEPTICLSVSPGIQLKKIPIAFDAHEVHFSTSLLRLTGAGHE
ncbi:hypothetical protein D3C85_1395620 [compost metagenome]